MCVHLCICVCVFLLRREHKQVSVGVEMPQEGGDSGLVLGGWGDPRLVVGGWGETLGWCRTRQSPAHLVLIKDIENKCGKLGGVPKWEELLVDLLEARRIQLPAGAVLDEALVPGGRDQARDGEGDSSITMCWELLASAPEARGPVLGNCATQGREHRPGHHRPGLIPPLPLISCVTGKRWPHLSEPHLSHGVRVTWPLSPLLHTGA